MKNIKEISLKRIRKDKERLEKNPLPDIHVIWDKEDIRKAIIMMIGPEKTPYEKGFYFFEMTFPQEYPFKCPSVKFTTRDGTTRFHPNLYRNGKVCLSLLGTWSGPGWSPSQNVGSLLMAIYSLLCEYPLTQEPGFETKAKSLKSKQYNQIITYQNVTVCIVDQLQNLPVKYKEFLPIMKQEFTKNIDWLLCTLSESIESSKNHKQYKFSFYNMSIKTDYQQVLQDVITTYNDINPEAVLFI